MDFEILKAQWEELEVWKKLLIVIGLTLGIGYLVYMFIISDKIAEKEKLENDLQNLKIELGNIMRNATPEKRAKLQQELKSEKEKTELLRAELEDLKAKFSPRDDAQTTLVFITDIVNKNNLVLNKFVIKGIKDVYLRYNPITKRIESETKNSSPSGSSSKSSLIPKSPFKKDKNKKEKENKVEDMPKVHLKKVDIAINLIGSPSDVVRFIRDVSYSKNYVRVEKVTLNRGKGNVLNADVSISSYFTPEALNQNKSNENNIFCKMVDIYYKCQSEAKNKRFLKDSKTCSKLSDNLAKNFNKEESKKINSACFAGCMNDKNFIKGIEKNCKK